MANDLSRWFDECEGGDALFVRGRLQQYSPLALFRKQLVASGVARAREVATYLERYNVQLGAKRGHYFVNQRAFCRWLMIASYRETMRLVLDVEPVEATLLTLADDDRFVLRMRYIDQFTDDAVARVLNLKLDTLRWPFVNATEARERSIRAYGTLCERLETKFPMKEVASSPSSATSSTLFPYYPGARVD